MRSSQKRRNLSTFFVQSIDIGPVSLHNPSCKLRKTMPAGALSYFSALTDTRRCLPCIIIIRTWRNDVNNFLLPLLIHCGRMALLPPARTCRTKRPQGAKSHVERRVRPDAKANGLGLGDLQQASRMLCWTMWSCRRFQ